MQITVEIKSQYGAYVIHPVCDKAKTFAQIAGTKTLTRDAIQNIKSLGFTVEVRQLQPVTL